ncbi:YbjN domain-containing protein [Corynebacterium tuberculostearicum]|uniref:YbjN domain-containing protein n=1 Tax=Corynebacterium tuberculostearicum TaxID=38304 RepID=UPI00265CF351|nr:YbjN domain-containing protein [Corynebacterium tuberculostearicum]MDV2432156.1 YbjN domain-containing protein [Corynebacterium tuberculostearicum]WKE57660.1 YbjN domain-containing protein [Corynebacterium tuberculostearicum]
MSENEPSLLLAHTHAIARENGISCWALPSGELLVPHAAGGSTFIFVDQLEEPVLHLHTSPRGGVDFSEIADLTHLANEWNHDCLSPAVVVDYDQPECVSITGHSYLPADISPSHEQLAAFLLPALRNAEVLIDLLAQSHPALVRETAPELAPLADAPLEPFTLDSLAEMLPLIGIQRFQSDGTTAIYAWVNDVLFAFALDNGPSLIIKGHWDPSLEEAEFTRLFLICNDWNRAHHGAVAFCHHTFEGLQVRMDAATITAAGLTRPQLFSAVGRGLKHILHGIDDIAREVTGASPVEWP